MSKSFRTLKEAKYFKTNLKSIPSTKFLPKFTPKMKKITSGIYSKTIDAFGGVIVRYRVTWRKDNESKSLIVDTLKEAKRLRKEKP